jgi:hypothetical protein
VIARSFRFRPRFRALAWGSIGMGGSMTTIAVAIGLPVVPLVSGLLGVALGAGYLALPAWRIAVTVDDAGLTVGSPARTRFRLAWADVVRVVASPATRTCFVDGGDPARSLLVPGDGAPAPYDIVDRGELVELILAHVPADKVQRVASLDQRDAPAG